MLQVKKFLCFTLETGGLIVGWFFLVENALMCLFSVVGVIYLSILECPDLKKMVEENRDEFNNQSCDMIRSIAFGFFIILGLFSLAFAVIGGFCISGTLKRNHNRIKPIVVALAVTAIFCFLYVLKLDAFGISVGLFFGIFYGYLFVCIYSLFYKIREEFERGLNPQYQLKADNA